MVVFGLIVEENDLIRAYFGKMASRLRAYSWLQPLKGNVGSRPYHQPCPKEERSSYEPRRLYVIDVEPIYSQYVFNVMIVFLVVAAVTLQLVFSWTGIAYVVYGFAALCALLLNMFWSAWFYEAMVRVQLRRLIGRKVQVSPGTLPALRGLANGKV